MKILFLTNKFPYPPKDGGAIATFQHVWGLADIGAEVTLLSINTKKHYFDVGSLPEDISRKVALRTVYIDTSLSALDAIKNLIFSDLPYNAERFISGDFEKTLVEVLTSTDFDFVQLEGLYLCPYINLIRKHTKAKISYRAHNIEHEIWSRSLSREKNHLKRRYLKILSNRLDAFERGFINQYDLLVPITSRDAEAFSGMGNTKPCHVSPTGVDPQNYKPRPDAVRYPSLFHLGALDWFPNQEGLLWFLRNVWRYLSKDYPELQFFVAGRNAPQWLVDEFKKFRNIVFAGEVEDAHDFLNKHAIMIVPIFSGGGMRIKIVEGMALQKTIISTPVGAEGIPITPGKEMLIATNPDEFSFNIEKMLNNRQLFDQIGTNALNFVLSKFDSKVIAQELYNFYESQL